MKRIDKNLFLIFIFLITGLLLAPSKAYAEPMVQEPIFSAPAGFYTEEFELSITTDLLDAMIYYTMDGSVPVPGNEVTYPYTAPILIKYQPINRQTAKYFCGTVIRAITVHPSGEQSRTSTASYFTDPKIRDRYQLPIISITTDPGNLYDRDTGIMAPGKTKFRGDEWERPIHFEYFDKMGELLLTMDAGIRLHGGASRDWAFKSFRIYARNEYDKTNKFKYDFFAGSEIPALVKNGENKGEIIDEFKRLILRAGGNEGTAGDGTLFRDALSQALMENTSLDLQGYSPAITFINGEFYGIHNLRERQDEDYIEDHYNVDENEVIIYEFTYDSEGNQGAVIVNGEEEDTTFYQNLVNYVKNNDLSVKTNYDQVKQWMDIENFVDYQIINIFGANRDWPGNNCKAWRARKDFDPDADYGLDGRIRWLVYDMDFNFGLYNPYAVNMDSLADATKAGGTEWPTQDGATLFLRKLLENDEFKTYFIQRFLDLMNTNFDKDYANALIDQIASRYRPSIDEFRNRYLLLHDWDRNIQTVKDFIHKREAIVKTQLATRFQLGKFYFLSLQTINDTNIMGGKVQVNTVLIDSNSMGVKDGIWKKSYYEGIPTILTAIPDEDYEFVSWSGSSDSTAPTLDASKLISSGNSVDLMPVFRLIEDEDTIAIAANSTNVVDSEVSDEISVEQNKEVVTFFPIVIILFVILLLFIIIYWRIIRKQK